MDIKEICWICRKPYADHKREDWDKCKIENEKRGEVIKKLENLLKQRNGTG